MNFNIVTPSYNQIVYLKRCIASVGDQVSNGALNVESVEASCKQDSLNEFTDLNDLNATVPITVHHHIQDGGSSDGNCEYLAEQAANSEQQTAKSYSFSFASEPDNGMYDALNRGVKLAIEGAGHKAPDTREPNNKPANCKLQTSNHDEEIIAWLNCDEQYLPGTLRSVARYFEDHPNVDILCGDVLLVDTKGRLLAYRKSYAPRRNYIEASHLYTLSCATFFRRRVFEQVGIFDATLKAAADEDFFLRALRMGFKAKHLSSFFSVFTITENNLGGGAPAYGEHLEIKARVSGWVRVLKPAINTIRHFEKWWSRAYRQKFPMEYAIYVDNLNERSVFRAQSGSWRWPSGS